MISDRSDLVCGLVTAADGLHDACGALAGAIACIGNGNGDTVQIKDVLLGADSHDNGIVTVTNNTSYEYQLQSFTYAGAPTDYKVIENGEIEPGASIFGAIVISAETPVTVVVNGTPTSVNIPANGVVFYCFAVKEAGDFNVVIDPAG